MFRGGERELGGRRSVQELGLLGGGSAEGKKSRQQIHRSGEMVRMPRTRVPGTRALLSESRRRHRGGPKLGPGRVQAVELLGIKQVPVFRLPRLREADNHAYVLTETRSAGKGPLG